MAKALSGDLKLEPEDRLFATLDTTAHRGKLPCGISLVYIDTVGFITDLPHELIKSFSTTLKDVKNAVSYFLFPFIPQPFKYTFFFFHSPCSKKEFL